MTKRTTPPFRADHVGSFLRPKYLLDAREQAAKGVLSKEELRKVEDKAIAEIVQFQEDVGLQAVTDGEFRRTYFHIDFLEQLGGVKTDIPVTITKPDGTQELAAKSSLARGDLMDSWEKSEQDARQGADYRKIRLERTTFRDRPAVVWEYTFTLQGEPWHARLLGFTEDGRAYQINTWYRPEAEERALETYARVRASFTVL